MAHQSPMISIPKKSTDDVDWTTPIRNLIATSYGESPDNYSAECTALQRCRQDAVKGAGSDYTARDLLYKYFGQLELLELRFSEIRVNFPWRDAFTNKLITQTSIAYEKASILFQVAATHTAIAASQSRSDPEGIKRAFYYFRSAAGMLNYINENFLHAPSTDLSREVVKFLVELILAQATEVFFEKCTDEKKGNALIAKIGAQAATMYTTLSEDVKEFMGKGIFDRTWVTLIQVKSKYFQSLAQYYRGLADQTANKHGEALVRFTLAENLAKEASKSASSFSSMFVYTTSTNLPSDAGTSIADRTKAHLVVCSERKAEAQRENDLIYNAILPAPEALPNLEKTAVATAIHIHDVYAAPDVQKTIGPDIFIKLVPLSVHESASVYSEEKAKLVRGEVEKADAAEGEAKSVVDGMGIKEGLSRFKAMAGGEVGGEEEVPLDVRRWKADITLIEERESVQELLGQLVKAKEGAQKELDTINRDLDIESRECEMMRVKYEHLWTQEPSAIFTKTMRQDLRSHMSSMEAAAASDQQVQALWDAVRSDIQLLLSPEVENIFRERGGSSGENLLDLDVGTEQEEAKERRKIKSFVDEVEDRLSRLEKIQKERSDILKDLKDKIQTDDVSHLLLLNRRNSAVEPTLFAQELEKFKPYQQRLISTAHAQDIVLNEMAVLWKGLRDIAGRGAGARKWEEREKKKKDTVRRFSRARDGYMEVRDGIAKGLQFYSDILRIVSDLRGNVHSYTARRASEREALAGKLETEKRLNATASSAPPPKPPPPPLKPRLESALGGLSLRDTSPAPSWQNKPPPPPPPSQASHQYNHQYTPSPQPSQHPSQTQTSSQFSSPPPPPQHQHQPPQHQYAPPSQQYNPPQNQRQSGYQSPYQQNPPPGPPLGPPSYGHSPSQSFPPPPPQSYNNNNYQPPQQSHTPSYLPPPPPRPVQSSMATNSRPQSDPYASLAFLGSNSFSSPPPPPNGQNMNSGFSPPPQQQHQQQQQPQYGYGYSQPQQQVQQPQQQYQQPQSYGGSQPPPPPPPSQSYRYASAPPPPPQQQQGGYQGYQQSNYGYNYGQ